MFDKYNTLVSLHHVIADCAENILQICECHTFVTAFYVYLAQRCEKWSSSHLRDTKMTERSISSFTARVLQKWPTGMSKDSGKENGLRTEGSTMALLMILVRRPSGPSYRYAIEYRDTRAETPVGDKPGTAKPSASVSTDGEERKGGRERERGRKRVPKRVQGLRLLDRPCRLSMISFTSKWKRASKTTVV